MLVSPDTVTAQSNSQINSGVQFDFPLPGARSLGLGGAFVAIADDATAAVANPAGLTQLTRPEISGEGRIWLVDSFTPSKGHAFGPPTNIGVDNIADIENNETGRTTGGPSFISAVFPKQRWAIGVYLHKQSQFRAQILSEGPFLSVAGSSDDRIRPYQGTSELDLTNYGVALAYRFGNGLAIGGGLALSDFSFDTRVVVAYRPPEISSIPPADPRNYVGLGQVYGPPNFAESNAESVNEETGDDLGVAANLGVLFRPVGKPWSIGGGGSTQPEISLHRAFHLGRRSSLLSG